MNNHKKSQCGYTLTEVLAVIFVLSISGYFVFFGLSRFLGYAEKQRATTMETAEFIQFKEISWEIFQRIRPPYWQNPEITAESYDAVLAFLWLDGDSEKKTELVSNLNGVAITAGGEIYQFPRMKELKADLIQDGNDRTVAVSVIVEYEHLGTLNFYSPLGSRPLSVVTKQ